MSPFVLLSAPKKIISGKITVTIHIFADLRLSLINTRNRTEDAIIDKKDFAVFK
jgi:hypothetical protein